MKQLILHEDARHLGITHPIACIISGVQVRTDSSALDHEIESLMQTLMNDANAILSRPEVTGFEDLFARMGYPEQKPAGRRLIELFQRNGFKRYNNIIDAYNISSAFFGSGLGMHDASNVMHGIEVYRANGTEQIIPLFKSEASTIKRGDLVYLSMHTGGEGAGNNNVIAWLGKRDVDSDTFKVVETTTDLLLVALGNNKTSEEYNRQSCLKTLDLIRCTCAEAEATFLEVSEQG